MTAIWKKAPCIFWRRMGSRENVWFWMRGTYGKAMVDFLEKKYRGDYSVLQAGTGDSPATLLFYKACGFVPSHTVPNFFTDNYRRPIYDGGVLLRDMIYLRKSIKP